ncbi:MAG: hypothetical protein Q9174_000039 [Haloplaca sp. 1 TL-2023]
MSLVDPLSAGNTLARKDKPSGPIKLKKAIVKNTKAKDSDSKAGSRSQSPDSQSILENDIDNRAPGPPTQPGDESLQKVRCKHCKTPTPKFAMASHMKVCTEKKIKERVPKKKESKDASARPTAGNEDKDSERAGDDSPVHKATGTEAITAEGVSSLKGVTKSAKKSAVKEATTDTKKSKKRKADAEVDKEPKKKKAKKDEPKPKVAKPKGPVDVEKQCEAAMDANAPLVDDDNDANVLIDSDEEKDAVMAAIARSRPQPLAQHVHIGLRKKYQRIRVKEALFQALTGQRGGNLFATRPPEAVSASNGPSQMNGATGHSLVEDGNVVQSPVTMGMGLPSGGIAGGHQNEGGGSVGGGGLARRPSTAQQAISANASAESNAAVADSRNATIATAASAGGQSRKSSVAPLAT